MDWRLTFNPVEHPILFSTPRLVSSRPAWHQHVPFAMFLVDLLRPTRLVELGTAAGDSYCAFCQAVDELGIDTDCYAVDTWRGDPHGGLYGPEVLEGLKKHHDPLYSRFSTLMQMSFDEAVAHFEDESVDVIHIDGYHTYEAVSRDVEQWTPKLSSTGVLLLHDTNERTSDFGVYRVWEEIKQRLPDQYFEFTHGHGLGVVAPNDVPAGLRELFARGGPSSEQVRRLFFALGERVTLRAQVLQSEERIAGASHQITDAESRAHQTEARIREIEARVQEAEAQAQGAEARSLEAEARAFHADAMADNALARVRRAETEARAAEAGLRDARTSAKEAIAEASRARAAAAHSQSELRSVVDSSAFRLTAPLRALNGFCRMVLHKILYTRLFRSRRTSVVDLYHRVGGHTIHTVAPLDADIEHIHFSHDRTRLRVAGWYWSSALRRPLLAVFVDGDRVATWHPNRRRPDIAQRLGFRRDRVGFDGSIRITTVFDDSVITVAVVRPGHAVLKESLARDLAAQTYPLDKYSVDGKHSPARRSSWIDCRTLSDYELWVWRHMLSPERRRAMKRECEALVYRPLLSVVMPVYNIDEKWLTIAVDSLRNQFYPHWELCIADDGSTRRDTRRVLRRLRRIENVKFVRLPRNRGIAAASNAALALASGEFVGFLDHDDELKPGALLEVVKLLNERPDLDYIFSDEDRADADGPLFGPFFKPGWSPDFLMSVNYVTHFSVYRRSFLEAIGKFREGFDGSQDYDLVLRATELTDRIAHIPWPLYTWRAIPGSAAASMHHKPDAWNAGKLALDDALRRRGLEGRVEPGISSSRYAVRYEPHGSPHVTVIVPTRDRLDLLRPCIESVRRRSSYPSYDILVVDHESEDPETLAYLAEASVNVMRYEGPFNFARMMNEAARRVDGTDFLVFLNNDTEVISTDWLEALIEHGQREDVAAVGARLLYPDGTPQHEGIIIDGDRRPHNITLARDGACYAELGFSIRNCSAVTAACLLIRRQLFREIGGFDEALDVAYNDVDLCLRALEKGYLNVYTPYALLYHKESATRKTWHPNTNTLLFRARWNSGWSDPYYNPRFSSGGLPFSFAP